MKDLDFDELDRAVNSLMKDAPKSEPEPKLTDEQTVTISPTINANDKAPLANLSQAMSDLNGPAAEPDASAARPVSTPDPLPKPDPTPTVVAPKQAPSVAARRGKFMDVVRPGAVRPEPPVRRQSREGVAIDPTRPIVNDVMPPTPNPAIQKEDSTAAGTAEVSPDTSAAVVKAEAASVVAPTPASEEPEDKSTKEDWPDPITMAGYEESELPTKSPETDKTAETDAPLVSPFLPDAKVEKRPLGGQPALASSETPKTESPETAEDSAMPGNGAPVAQLPASPTNEKPLPEELSGDVMALESDANTAAVNPESPKEPAMSAQQAPEPVPEKPPVSPESVSVMPSASATPPTPTSAISIPQQYKEEPSSSDTSTGSIYDTDTYHKPLAHPGKKKSGWMWVIWIILILIVGAGAGAALYYFKVF